MPESARIIERRHRQVNSAARCGAARRGSVARAFAGALLVLLLAASAGGCTSQGRAARLYEKSQELVQEDRLDEAIELLEQILDEYPDTDAALNAAEDIGLYRSLAGAVERFPMRRARDLMVGTARQIEGFRGRSGSYPASLERLVPSRLAELPVDPWDRPLIYRRKPGRRGGYVLACYGEDGQPGGSGDAGDLLIENGRFVTKLSGPTP